MFAVINKDGTIAKMVSCELSQISLQLEGDQTHQEVIGEDADLIFQGPCKMVGGRVVSLPKVEDREFALQRLRNNRDRLLQSSDWTQVPDAPVDQAAWAAYRQLLRDLPSTTTDPFNVQWPKSPSATNTEGYA